MTKGPWISFQSVYNAGVGHMISKMQGNKETFQKFEIAALEGMEKHHR